MKDLIDRDAYKLALIIYGEKEREKFEVTTGDKLIGIEIFSAQEKMDEYRELF